MATYYIDPTGNDTTGDGSIETPWASLYKATSTITSSGNTIYVNAGTYNESNQCDLAVGVSLTGAGNTSILNLSYSVISYWNGGCIRLGSSTSNTDGNQSISYLKFVAGTSTIWECINVRKRSNVIIHDCTFEDFQGLAICFFDESWTAYNVGNEVYNCNITDCSTRVGYGEGAIKYVNQDGLEIYNNILIGTGKANGYNGNLIQAHAGTDNKGIKIYGNKFYKPLLEQLYEWNFSLEVGDVYGGCELYDNEFYNGTCNIAASFNVKGTYDYSWYIHDNLFISDRQITTSEVYHSTYGLNFEGTCEDIIIERNLFENYPTCILQELGQTPRDEDNIKVQYNIFKNIGYSNGGGYAIRVHSYSTSNIMQNLYYDNNVVYGNGATAAFYFDATDEISTVKIRNNTVYGIETTGWLVFGSTVPQGIIDDIAILNNCLYNNVNTNDIYYGMTPTNVVYTDNIESDPLFVSTSDFHLQALSPCRNAGIDVGLTTDYDEVAISGLPDIGAYEYIDDQLIEISQMSKISII